MKVRLHIQKTFPNKFRKKKVKIGTVPYKWAIKTYSMETVILNNSWKQAENRSG